MPRKCSNLKIEIGKSATAYLQSIVKYGSAEKEKRIYLETLRAQCIAHISTTYNKHGKYLIEEALNQVTFGRIITKAFPKAKRGRQSSYYKNAIDRKRFYLNLQFIDNNSKGNINDINDPSATPMIKPPFAQYDCATQTEIASSDNAMKTISILEKQLVEANEKIKELSSINSKLREELNTQKLLVRFHIEERESKLRMAGKELDIHLRQCADEAVLKDSQYYLGQNQTSDVGPTLGRGSYGTVKLAKLRKSEAHVAKKTFNQNRTEDAKHEIAILLHLKDHPCIQKLLGFNIDVDNGPVLLTQFRSLDSVYKEQATSMDYVLTHQHDCKLTTNDYKSHVKCLVDAVSFIHEMGILHNDIKTNNYIVCTPSHGILIDFGMATSVDKVYKRKRKTNCLWIAPEVRDDRLQGSSIQSDVFSIGYFVERLVVDAHLKSNTLNSLSSKCSATRKLDRPPLAWCRQKLSGI